MCGIAGVASIGGGVTELDRGSAAAMAASLAHRGPDGHGQWSDEWVTLAHRRLAVIDLSDAGEQPMMSPSSRLVVALNGEIYNYQELADRLRRLGWQRRGGSDTEVLLAAIEQWGLTTALRAVDGMFALALYDRVTRRLSLARDRFGEKPLVYARSGNRIAFASEVRSFDVVPWLTLTLDPSALADMFRFGHVIGTSTIFTEVHRVAPATVMEFDLTSTASAAEPVTHTYWSPTDTFGGHQQLDLEVLGSLLDDSVRRRCVADRPLGAFLSGGVDSSLTCALAARHVGGSLRTYTMAWEQQEFDESRHAQAVAMCLGADHTTVRLSRSDVVAAVGRLGRVMDEPFADSSQLATLLVASAARDELVVALTGDGGDELFAGYNRHRWLLRSARVQRGLPRSARRSVAAVLRGAAPALDRMARPIPVSRRPRNLGRKIAKFADALAAADRVDAYQGALTIDHGVGRPRDLEPAVAAAILEDDPCAALWGLRVADLAGYMCDDVLTKVDRATMAVALEARTPFLESAVAEYALALGPQDLIGTEGGKKPLRQLLQQLLPDVSFDQPKTGFAVPVADLLRAELLADLRDAASDHQATDIDWSIRIEQLMAGDDRTADTLWSLLMFESWQASRRGVPS